MCTCSLNERLVIVLTKLEIALPLYWNTSTRHYLLHMCMTMLRLGSFWYMTDSLFAVIVCSNLLAYSHNLPFQTLICYISPLK